jgi:hypothetical protein
MERRYGRSQRQTRRNYKLSRLDHVRNDRIKEIMDLDKTIIDRVEEKQLVWYGHLQGCQKRGGQRRFGNGPHVEEGEEDDHEGPGPIISRRP